MFHGARGKERQSFSVANQHDQKNCYRQSRRFRRGGENAHRRSGAFKKVGENARRKKDALQVLVDSSRTMISGRNFPKGRVYKQKRSLRYRPWEKQGRELPPSAPRRNGGKFQKILLST